MNHFGEYFAWLRRGRWVRSRYTTRRTPESRLRRRNPLINLVLGRKLHVLVRKCGIRYGKEIKGGKITLKMGIV
jgi:hypothetical protein